jgi:hypothetical protein
MIGVYDFCGHYEWTFGWLQERGGRDLVREYWEKAIYGDAQLHATQQIVTEGFEGMRKYWGHTLEQEVAGYTLTSTDAVCRIDMHSCPSKGFLVRNGLLQYEDYCDHCIGWIGPLMRDAGFVIDHEHNHAGQCWWEVRRTSDATPPGNTGELSGEQDVRLRPNWSTATIDVFSRANDDRVKRANSGTI